MIFYLHFQEFTEFISYLLHNTLSSRTIGFQEKKPQGQRKSLRSIKTSSRSKPTSSSCRNSPYLPESLSQTTVAAAGVSFFLMFYFSFIFSNVSINKIV